MPAIGPGAIYPRFKRRLSDPVFNLVREPNERRGRIVSMALTYAPHVVGDGSSTIDRIAREVEDFHFGRFDIRFKSLRDLRAGRNFAIVELNGAASSR